MKIGPQIQFQRKKWWETKERKKSRKKFKKSKKSGRILPNIIQTQFVPKTRKTYMFLKKRREKMQKKCGGNVVFFIFYILKIYS